MICNRFSETPGTEKRRAQPRDDELVSTHVVGLGLGFDGLQEVVWNPYTDRCIRLSSHCSASVHRFVHRCQSFFGESFNERCTTNLQRRVTFSAVTKGYGLLIWQAREAKGWSRTDLAKRIGRSAATVQRIEEEKTEPSVEQINRLVAALPLSVEDILAAMGVNIVPTDAARLPRRLVETVLQLDPEHLRALEFQARALLAHQERGDEPW